ncbi:MAG: hypothetical protein WA642_01590 [Steroidobacteraceae bacterium]
MSSIQPTPQYSVFTNKWIANYYQIQANKEAAMDKIQADLDSFITQTYMHMSANAQRESIAAGSALASPSSLSRRPDLCSRL